MSDAEIDAYVRGLEPLGSAAMLAGQLDGLLAAVLTAPEEIPPEVWLSSIWVLDEGDPEPDIDPEAPEVQQAIASVIRRLNELGEGLETGTFEPLFDSREDGSVAWETWADGFMVGMTLCMNAWGDRLLARSSPAGEAARLLVTLIEVSRNDPETLAELGAKTVAQFRRDAPDLLTECVLVLAEGDAARAPVIHGPKVGRNDPCPCGSGKKYKKCCGGA